MKKKCWLLLVMLLCLLVLTGCKVDESGYGAFEPSLLDDYRSGTTVKIRAADSDPANFHPVLENENYELCYNEKTAEIICREEATGKVFRSNNAAWAKDHEGAQLLLTLANPQGTQYAWNSLTDAVAYGQVQTEVKDGALEVTYLFGKTAQVYAVPRTMTVEAFETLLARVEKSSDQSTLKRLYSYLELKETDLPKTRDMLLERFPVLEKMPLYALSGTSSKMEMKKLEKIFASVGYTLEQKAADEAACEFTAEEDAELHVAATLRYTLTEDGLRAEIPYDRILVSEGARLVDITLLPYFGAPAPQKNGYAVIPDGCGALLDMHTLRDSGYPAYSARVYGVDYANQVTDRAAPAPLITLPVMGVKGDRQALTATVVQGAPFATLVADAPRTDGSLGYAGIRFLYMETAYFSLDAKPENRIMCYQPRANHCDMAVEYTLLTEDDADYNTIAQAMKNSLSRLGLLGGEASGRLPLVLETIGAIDVEELVLGVPVTRVRPLTTFDQTADIALSLKDEADGLRVIANGAMTGGLRTTRQMRITPEKALGGMNGLKKLHETLREQNIPLAVAAEAMYVHKDRMFDGFGSNRDTARLLTSVSAFRPDYTLSNMHMTADGMAAYMLRREAILENLAGLDASAQALGLEGLALPGVGDSLYSDMRAADNVNRDEMRSAIQTAVENMQTDAWLRAGYAYALPGASLVYDIPLHASAHPLFAEEIPLVQMILSGYVDYAATSMQYAADEQSYLLRCIESGSGLYAQVYAESGSAVKYTDFDDLYAGSWPLMAARLQEAYASARGALDGAAGREILHHSRQSSVSRTLFAGGTAVYVNSGEQAAAFTAPDGTTIELAPHTYMSRKEAAQ